jgi:hypothetical protein
MPDSVFCEHSSSITSGKCKKKVGKICVHETERTTILPRTGTCFQTRSQSCEKRLLAESCPSFCLSTWNNSAVTGRMLMKHDIGDFFRTSIEKILSFTKIRQE